MKKEVFSKALPKALPILGVVGAAVASAMLPDVSFAITPPTQGSFGYDFYDIAVNKILKGPIGFIGGVAAMVFGAIQVIGGRVILAVPSILGGAALLKADAIVESLGALI